MHSDPSTPWERQFEELVLGVLPRHSRHAPLDPALDLKTAGLDSMATVELLVRLEEAYGVDFPDSVLSGETFATPAALWRVLTAQRATATATTSATTTTATTATATTTATAGEEPPCAS